MLESYSQPCQLPEILSCEKQSFGIFNLQSIQNRPKKRWTQQEKKMLTNLYKSYGDDWQRISNQIGTRTPHACSCMANSLKLSKKQFKKGKQYNNQEDQQIINLYKSYPEEWQNIAKHFKDRSARAVKYRYRQLFKFRSRSLKKVNYPEITLRNWTIQQDQLLLALVNILQYDWNSIASFFSQSNSNICYWRYNHLKSVKQPILWKFQEDNKLLELFQVFNGDWEKISKQIGNNRNPYKCLKRFHKLKRKNLKNQWSQHDLNHLYEAFSKYKGNWKQIQKQMQKFSVRQCYFKYYHDVSRNKRSYDKQVEAIKKFWSSKKQKKYQKLAKKRLNFQQFWMNFQNKFFQGLQQQLAFLQKILIK